jgi:hypothetical protein
MCTVLPMPKITRKGKPFLAVAEAVKPLPKPTSNMIPCPYCDRYALPAEGYGGVRKHNQDRTTPCVPSQEDAEKRREQHAAEHKHAPKGQLVQWLNNRGVAVSGMSLTERIEKARELGHPGLDSLTQSA